MPPFPAIDPIPLPAPVWLMKALLVLTFALHIAAVQMLLGGLIVAPALTLFGRSAPARSAALAIARRLPVVMTYVINLGVPPLLFSQVLYGRALYTSSVLMGLYWILVIPLLMLCYWLLYRYAAQLEAGRREWWSGAIALVTAIGIAKIYSSNMTLMLRPEAWQSMYAAGESGTQLPTGDPTLVWRWLFALAGGPLFAGLWMLWLAARRTFHEIDRRYLARLGGLLAAIMALAEAPIAALVVQSQPAATMSRLASNPVYQDSRYAWIVAIALAAALGIVALLRPMLGAVGAWAAVVIAFLSAGSLALYRDGLRDATLAAKGFDVWQLPVATNWSVVIVFLILFVAGLAAVGWLLSVVFKARKTVESIV